MASAAVSANLLMTFRHILENSICMAIGALWYLGKIAIYTIVSNYFYGCFVADPAISDTSRRFESINEILHTYSTGISTI